MTAKHRTQPVRRQPARPVVHGDAKRSRIVLLVLGLLLVASLGAVVWGLVGGASPSSGMPLAELRTSDIHAIRFAGGGDDVLYFGHHHGLLRSDDGGRTWSAFVDRPNFDAMGVAQSGSRLYVAGHDVFQMSDDGGRTWAAVIHNLPGTDIHAFSTSPLQPDRLYAFVVGHGLYRSEDSGASWVRVSSHLPADVMGLHVAPGAPETLYAASMSAGVLISSDAGASWVPLNEGLGTRRVLAVAGLATGGAAFAGTSEGLYRIDEGQRTWRRLPYPGRNAAAVAVSQQHPNVVVAVESVGSGTARVYRSDDGGQSWVSKDGNQ